MLHERRSILATALDAFIIPLPFGATLATIDPIALNVRALRAVLLSKRLQGSDSPVPRISHFAVRFKGDRLVRGKKLAHRIFLLDHILVLLDWSGILDVYDIHDGKCLFSASAFDSSVPLWYVGVDCKLSEDRTGFMLTTAINGSTAEECARLLLNEYSFRDEEGTASQRLHLIRRLDARLPAISLNDLAFHDDFIVAKGMRDVLIYNWRCCTGVTLRLSEEYVSSSVLGHFL